MLSRLNRFASRATEASRESSWTIFRLLIAAMFMTHGYAKLLGDNPVVPVGRGMTRLKIGDLVSYAVPMDINLLFVAGVIKLAGGALILIGLWTHLVSLLAIGTMTFAYAIAHLAWFPTLNEKARRGVLGELSNSVYLRRRTLQRRYLAGDTPAGKAAQENGRAVILNYSLN